MTPNGRLTEILHKWCQNWSSRHWLSVKRSANKLDMVLISNGGTAYACSAFVISVGLCVGIRCLWQSLFHPKMLSHNREVRRDRHVDRNAPSLGCCHSTRLRQSFSSDIGVLRWLGLLIGRPWSEAFVWSSSSENFNIRHRKIDIWGISPYCHGRRLRLSMLSRMSYCMWMMNRWFDRTATVPRGIPRLFQWWGRQGIDGWLVW